MANSGKMLPYKMKGTTDFTLKDYDCVVLVAENLTNVRDFNQQLEKFLAPLQAIDNTVNKTGCLVPGYNGGRIVFAPTGPLDRDFDDVRRYADAANKGIKRALDAGSKRPVLTVVPSTIYPHSVLAGVLGALEALYVPLQMRESSPEKAAKIPELAVYGALESEIHTIIQKATVLEAGRFVARDLGGGDPERMSPPKFAGYVQELFANTKVTVEVINQKEEFEKSYPLFAAVNRAASAVPRHNGQIIFLKYEGEGPITQTIMPVGKGITYDTGGADIKAGGIMAGMSRDKCGAAAVAGFFQVLQLTKPAGIKAIGGLAVARNSVGEECYVADEVIISRAGVKVRIGNTDAEGRMVMTDVLCKLKELALQEINPHLMTIATLTGHACLAVGGYSAVMDNGPAHAQQFAQNLQRAGEQLGDMIEISTIRREDYDFIKCASDGDADILQCNNAPSSRTPRGHQFPAAFMIEASGLIEHGKGSKHPLKYSHFDIAGSGGDFPKIPSGVPIIALAQFFLGDSF